MEYIINGEECSPVFFMKALAHWFGHDDVSLCCLNDGAPGVIEAGNIVAKGEDADKLILDAIKKYQEHQNEEWQKARTSEYQPGDMIWVQREDYGIPMIFVRMDENDRPVVKPAFKFRAAPGEVTLGNKVIHYRIQKEPGFQVDVYKPGFVSVPAPTQYDADNFFWSCRPEIPATWAPEGKIVERHRI